MTTPLPSYIKTGRVLGPQLVVSVDTAADVDKQPDAAFPVGSTLVFTPGVSSLSYTDGAAHAVAYLKPVTAVIGSDGNPETPSGDELWLPATENQGLANDQQWTWRVTPQIVGMTGIPSFAFRVTSGVDNYLSDQQPIPAASASSAVARGRDGAGAPPPSTPDHYMAVAVGESTVWMSPAAAAALLESTLNGVYASYDAGTEELSQAGDVIPVLTETAGDNRYAPRLGTQYMDAHGADSTGVASSDAARAACVAGLMISQVTGEPVGEIVYGPGTYRHDTPPPYTGSSVFVRGRGERNTIIMYYGSGACFRFFSRNFLSSGDSDGVTGQSNFIGGGIRDLTVDGANSQPGAIGVKYGDMIGFKPVNVTVQNFDKTGSANWAQINTISWTEKTRMRGCVSINGYTHMRVSVDFADDTTTIRTGFTTPNDSTTTFNVDLAALPDSWARPVGDFTSGPVPNIYVNGAMISYTGITVHGDGTATLTGCLAIAAGDRNVTVAVGATAQCGSAGVSHGYCDLDLMIAAQANQRGLSVTNGANLYSGSIRGRGNWANGTVAQDFASGGRGQSVYVSGNAPTGTRLSPNHPAADIADVMADWKCEAFGPGSYAPQTLYIDTGSSIRHYVGSWVWKGATATLAGGWVTSNVSLANAAKFVGIGFIVGDASLFADTTLNGTSGPVVRGGLQLAQGHANSTGPVLNIGDGDEFLLTLNSNSTSRLVFNGNTAGPARKTVVVQQQKTGGVYNRALTWPNGAGTVADPLVIWLTPGGVAPTQSTGLGATDAYVLDTVDGGTWYGRVAQQASTVPPFTTSTSGPPTSGTWAVDTVSFDIATPALWLCTVAGTPGTWVNISSNTAAGIKGNAVPARCVYGAGEYLGPAGGGTSAVLVSGSSGKILGYKLAIPTVGTPNSIGVQVSNAGSGATLQFAIRAVDANGAPSTLLASTAAVPLTGAGFVSAAFSTPIPAADTYCVEVLITWTTTAPTLFVITTALPGVPQPAGSAINCGYSSVQSSIPSSLGSFSWTNNVPSMRVGV